MSGHLRAVPDSDTLDRFDKAAQVYPSNNDRIRFAFALLGRLSAYVSDADFDEALRLTASTFEPKDGPR